jgi:hypothetical protein
MRASFTRIPLLGLLLITSLSFPSQESSAQSERRWGYDGSTGYTHTRDGDGWALGLGATRFFRFVGLTITPMDLTFVPQEGDSRYYEDTFSNGQTRCRDSATGQFASDSKCGGAYRTLYAASVTARLNIPVRDNEWYVGGGYRAGSTSTPYGAVGFVRQPDGAGAWFVELRTGSDLVQATIGATLNSPFWLRKAR